MPPELDSVLALGAALILLWAGAAATCVYPERRLVCVSCFFGLGTIAIAAMMVSRASWPTVDQNIAMGLYIEQNIEKGAPGFAVIAGTLLVMPRLRDWAWAIGAPTALAVGTLPVTRILDQAIQLGDDNGIVPLYALTARLLLLAAVGALAGAVPSTPLARLMAALTACTTLMLLTGGLRLIFGFGS